MISASYQKLTPGPPREDFCHRVEISANSAESSVEPSGILLRPFATSMLDGTATETVIRGAVETGLLCYMSQVLHIGVLRATDLEALLI